MDDYDDLKSFSEMKSDYESEFLDALFELIESEDDKNE